MFVRIPSLIIKNIKHGIGFFGTLGGLLQMFLIYNRVWFFKGEKKIILYFANVQTEIFMLKI